MGFRHVYTGDNCSANFSVYHSLFTNIKAKNPNVIKSNYYTHMLHNSVKKLMEYLDVVVENIILQMHSNFTIFAKIKDILKEFQWFFKLTFQLFQN